MKYLIWITVEIKQGLQISRTFLAITWLELNSGYRILEVREGGIVCDSFKWDYDGEDPEKRKQKILKSDQFKFLMPG